MVELTRARVAALRGGATLVRVPFFDSTALARAEYDEGSRTLRVWFTHGGEPYDYREVPPEVFAGLCAAGSQGSYFNDHIRDRYDFEVRERPAAAGAGRVRGR